MDVLHFLSPYSAARSKYNEPEMFGTMTWACDSFYGLCFHQLTPAPFFSPSDPPPPTHPELLHLQGDRKCLYGVRQRPRLYSVSHPCLASFPLCPAPSPLSWFLLWQHFLGKSLVSSDLKHTDKSQILVSSSACGRVGCKTGLANFSCKGPDNKDFINIEAVWAR